MSENIKSLAFALKIDRSHICFRTGSDSWNWAWAKSLKSPTGGWESGAAGSKRLDGPLLNQLREDFCDLASDPCSELPEGWKTGRAMFIPSPCPGMCWHTGR